MDFFLSFFAFGSLLMPVPVDRSGFPARADVHYEDRTSIGDQREEFHLVGSSLLRRSRMTLSQGRPVGDTDYADMGLTPEGYIRSTCSDKGCDYRQDGKEFLYSGGRVTAIRRYRDGALRDSIAFTYANGRLTGGMNGMIKITWNGDKLARNWEGVGDTTYLQEDFEYAPSGDSLVVRFYNILGDPHEGVHTYRLVNGRPTVRIERDNLGLFSTRTFQYNVTTAVATLWPAPSARPWKDPVDALGRALRAGSSLLPATLPSSNFRKNRDDRNIR